MTEATCEECGEVQPLEEAECPHGRPLCRRCALAWCYRCATDLEADHQDAIFDGVRNASRDRKECDG